jgi:GntR family transcriptional repressor for pyruvate dehydrogenase complex
VAGKSPEPEFGAVDRTILWKQIADQLLAMLRERQLGPGDKLPPERELAAMMQVSRPSLREALRALETELLVEPLDFVVTLDDSSLIELFEARKIVELGIMGLAAQRITEEELAELEAGLSRSRESVNDPAAFLQADVDLHKIITRAARNPIMSRVIDSISRLLLLSRSRTVEVLSIRAQTIEDHRAIVAALKKRDVEAAKQAMLQHLNNVEQGFVHSDSFSRRVEQGRASQEGS